MSIDRRSIAHFDWVLLIAGCLIPCLGLVVLYSAGYDPDSAGISLGFLPWKIQSTAFVKQLLFLSVGLVVMGVAVLVPHSFLFRISYLVYGLGIVLLLTVMFAGVVVNGSRRWLNFGSFNLQPAEMMKLGLALALSRYLSRHPPSRGGYRLKECVVPFIMVGVPMLLIAQQPDLGSALSLGAVGAALILFMGVNYKTILGLLLAVLIAVVPGWHFLHDYQKRRILVLIDPEGDPLGSGYHIIQSKIAVGSGGLSGKGYLKGTQSQLEFLPEHTTDFIFSVLAEEWGFLGCISVLVLYAFLIYRMVRVVGRSRDLFAALLVFGVLSVFFFHSVINIGMVVGVFPVVGIPLPLFSYGGSSVLSTMVGLGIVLGVSMRRFLFAART